MGLESKIEAYNAKNLEELNLIYQTFSKLSVDVAVTKDVNSLLSPQLADMENQCWRNVHYSRRRTFEILGLPKLFSNDEVETKVC